MSIDASRSSSETAHEVVQTEPNRFWTLQPFVENPASVSDYMAANCTTRTMEGPSRAGRLSQIHFRSFTRNFGDDGHSGVNDTFDMCVNTFEGYEAYAKYALLRSRRNDDGLFDPPCCG